MRNYSKQTSHSENTTNSGNTASPTLNRQEKEEEAHEDQHGIEVVPSIGEESFRSKGYDPQHQLHQKDPNEYVIQNGSSFPDVIREDERIDKGENDENGNSQLEDPVLNDDFEFEPFLHEPSERNPAFDIIKRWRHHRTIVQNGPAQVHKLPDLLNITISTMRLSLFSSTLMQISAINSTYLYLWRYRAYRNLTKTSKSKYVSSPAKVTKAIISECCCLISLISISLLQVYLNLL